MSIVLESEIKNLLRGNIEALTDATVQELNVTENGTYTPPTGVDGYAPVNVNVPDVPAVVQELNVTENGTYTPPTGVDGYSPVNVNVPDVPAVVQELNVTENGTYTPPTGVDGYSPVNVNVKGKYETNGYYVKNPFANGSSSGSKNIATGIFNENASVNNFLLNLSDYYFTGSNRYTCTTLKNSYNSETGYLNISWTAQSGSSTQYFYVVYVDDINNIHNLSDWTTYNTNGTYEFDLPSEAQDLSSDDFIIEFKNFVTGGASFSGTVTKIIENNKLKVTFPFSSSAVSFDARILYIK